jgi:hypothetical protein
MLNAFCRVAPSVRFNFLAILEAGVFRFAMVFSSRTSDEVHARRFLVRLAIEPPLQMQVTCIPCGSERKAKRRNGEQVGYDQTIRREVVRFSLTRYARGSKYIFQPVPGRHLPQSTAAFSVVCRQSARTDKRRLPPAAAADVTLEMPPNALLLTKNCP